MGLSCPSDALPSPPPRCLHRWPLRLLRYESRHSFHRASTPWLYDARSPELTDGLPAHAVRPGASIYSTTRWCAHHSPQAARVARSEERRVGKDRGGWWQPASGREEEKRDIETLRH